MKQERLVARTGGQEKRKIFGRNASKKGKLR